MKKDTQEKTALPLLPVLPSWGSMIREMPPAGYGDMRFDPQPSTGEEEVRDEVEPTWLDLAAAESLQKHLPI